MKDDAATVRTPSWQGVVLICRACRKRGNGPKKLRPKALVATARKAVGPQRPRPRVVMTTCLGLCPKAAIAVASVGASSTRLAAVRSKRELASALVSMLGEGRAAENA